MTDSATPRDGNEQSLPTDIVSITTSEYSRGIIRTGLIEGEISPMESSNVEFGVQVHQDGPEIAFSAGTIWTPEDTAEIKTYQSLTREQARQIRDGLDEAIANAEAGDGEYIDQDDNQSLIDRLVELVK